MDLKKAAVAVTYNPNLDQFLVLKRSKDRERFPDQWEFPSGFVERSEDSRNAALRELEEETGLVGNAIRTGETFEVETEKHHFMVQPVLIKVEGSEIQMTREHQDFRWVDVKEIKTLDSVPKLRKDLEAVGII